MRKYAYIVLFFLNFQSSFAQIAGFQIADLPQSIVINKLFEASDHRIWIASNDGIFIFNGESYEKIDLSNLPKENFTAIFEDSNKNIVFGCESGNLYWANRNNLLTKWNPQEGLPQKKITAIKADKNGNIWFSTYGEGLYVYDKTYIYNFNKSDGLSDDAIYDIVIDDRNDVWVTTDQGINICSFLNKKKNVRKISVQNGLSDELIKCITISYDKKSVYVGYQKGGIDKIDIDTKKISNFCQNIDLEDANNIFQLPDNQLVISTENNGIFLVNQNKDSAPKKIISSNKVYSLFIDNQSNIWASTAEKGLFYYNLLFNKTEFKEDLQIQVLYDDLVGTSKGLYLNQLDKMQLVSSPKINVIAIVKDNRNDHWIGTFGQGLYLFKNNKLTKFNNLPDQNILSIQSYQNGILAATLSGIFHIKQTEKGYEILDFNQEIKLPKYYVYKLLLDKKGTLWIGTDGKGLYRYDGKSLLNYSEVEGEKFKTVYSIDADENGHIWFGAEEVGLVEIVDNLLKYKNIKGLRSFHIIDVVCNSNNKILIVHDKGIEMLDVLKNELFYVDQFIPDFKMDNILNSNNYRYNRFEIASGNNIYCMDDRFFSLPKVSINKIEVNGVGAQNYENNEFDSDKNNFHFYCSSMFLNYKVKPVYEYFLEGYDSKWRSTQNNVIEYQNLSSKSYNFKIRAVYGSYSSDLVEYQYVVKLPIWKRWWFVLLTIASIFLIFYYWILNRDIKRSNQLRLERENVENQLIALKSQINPHFLFNTFNTLIAIIESDPEVAVEFVSRLSDFYRKVMIYREKNTIPIQEELSLIEDYAFLIKKRFGDNIIIRNQIHDNEGFVVPFAIQMLIENAVKHNIATKEHPLNIDLQIIDNFIYIKNNFQPKKIKEPSTGFGLSFIKKHYEFLSKLPVDISSDSNLFIVKLPLLKNESINS
ncbi:MAG: histidine kinase [Saprospiraceae bacterium]|nr:histidine kinase [Saprospiraceae bacterium]